MGQVTENTCQYIIEYAGRDERFPLTVNEMRQLAYLAQKQIEAGRRTTPDREAIIEQCARVCDARYMGDNNREDMEARRCAQAIRALKITANGEKK
jgi:hypothetical protein